MQATKGFIGEHGTDGYVTYITVDDGNSYLPTIHCGAFELVIARGSHWTGLADESLGVVLAAPYGEQADGQPKVNATEATFAWHQDAFLRAVADALEELEDAEYEHPAAHNVLDAARELWIAMRLEGREAF